MPIKNKNVTHFTIYTYFKHFARYIVKFDRYIFKIQPNTSTKLLKKSFILNFLMKCWAVFNEASPTVQEKFQEKCNLKEMGYMFKKSAHITSTITTTIQSIIPPPD